MAKLTEAQRQILVMVAAADDGYETWATDPRMLDLWKRDLLDFYAPDCAWFITDAGRAALQAGAQDDR